MKANITLAVLALGIIFGGCSDETPTQPNNPQTGGEGIIAGMAYVAYYEGDWFKYRNANIEVSLLGTNLSTMTDSLGKWVLRNIDSGSYTIRFTKSGPYDTSFAYRVYSNGTDSIYLKEVITDTTWTGVQKTGGDVRELPPNLSVTSCTTVANEIIRFDTMTVQGQLQYIPDTTYTWSGEFTIGVDAPNPTLNDKLPVSYLCCLSEKAQLAPTDLPDKLFIETTHNNQIGYWGREIERVPPGEQPLRTFSFIDFNQSGLNTTQFIKARKLQKASGNKLYFHIIPICQGQVRTTDEQWGTPNVIRKQNIMSRPYSFEVQWQ